MVVIVLVTIASAALFALLAVELGRLGFGEFRVPRPAIGLLRSPANKVVPSTERREPSSPASERPAPAAEDVEQRVRDQLYGERSGAIRRAPTSAD